MLKFFKDVWNFMLINFPETKDLFFGALIPFMFKKLHPKSLKETSFLRYASFQSLR